MSIPGQGTLLPMVPKAGAMQQAGRQQGAAREPPPHALLIAGR